MRDWPDLMGLPLWGWLFVLPMVLVLLCAWRPASLRRLLTPVWAVLDRLYLLGGGLSAVFMVLILVIIVFQMIARWSGLPFPGSTEFAGYAMAATSFFALAYALNRGSHIRVSIFLNLNPFTHRWLDFFATLTAAIVATYFARYAVRTNIFSKLLNDRTQGQDMVPEGLLSALAMFVTPPGQWGALWAETGSDWVFTPIWVPQLPMSIGTILLAVALWDNLTRMAATGISRIRSEAVE
ncbi:TRAP transporter small permease [Sedimentitalea nanhaiensis]|uniref:TRAP transporter small permease protein n=1 Tax=Sedimentitalea nanhaiensis TaxID=999627 RepID=A0A1I6YKV8_9RHOB|nr:TRAP transporter small permease [Sedimentitalea nanhaiensis]SFT51116.1 Tripartite ATP-independent transporter, DctQ component [Sedimentitalea nanhaiensis]